MIHLHYYKNRRKVLKIHLSDNYKYSKNVTIKRYRLYPQAHIHEQIDNFKEDESPQRFNKLVYAPIRKTMASKRPCLSDKLPKTFPASCLNVRLEKKEKPEKKTYMFSIEETLDGKPFRCFLLLVRKQIRRTSFLVCGNSMNH